MQKLLRRTVSLWLAAAVLQTANAAVIVVNTNTDVANGADGLCSLREAITASDTNVASGALAGECIAGSVAPVPDVISMSVGGLITLDPVLGGLPAMTDGFAAFNGWAAPGAGPNRKPKVGIDCGLVAVPPPGLLLSSPNNIVRGFAVINCGTGIGINNPNGVTSDNWIYGNVLGMTPNGMVAANVNGIIINEGADDNLIGTNGDGVRDVAERNLISGNTASGILITSIGTDGNRIAGNVIGPAPGGMIATVPQQNNGVTVASDATNTIIGTNSDGNHDLVEGNLISGHVWEGILLTGGTNTVVAGNLIGTTRFGDAPLANDVGIEVWEAVSTVQIGTDGDGSSDTEERNVISGNTMHGVELVGTLNTVAGNYIGLGSDGITQVPNLTNGILVRRGAGLTGGVDNLIGGPGPVFTNHISANSVRGIEQDGDRNTIECNIVGADIAGVSAPNGFHGIVIQGDDNVIHNNDIVDHATNGILFDTSGLNFSVTENNIVGNVTGARSTNPNNLVIEDNWWGDASGPFHVTGNPGGLGDEVDDSGGGALDYDPWLAAPSGAGACL